MSRRFSPASLKLASVGVTHERIAARAGVDRSTITAQLAGLHNVRPYLIPSIRQVAGPDVAAEIAAILGVEVTI